MERIWFRLIVVLSIIGVLAGVPAMYVGSLGVENWPKTGEELGAKNSSELKRCLGDSSQWEVAKECYDTYWRMWGWATKTESDGYNNAVNLETAGLAAAVFMPLTLFAIFYILRWIATGRWRRERIDGKA